MRLTVAQQALAADNIGFAHYLSNKWANKQKVIDREELDSIACEALCKAAALYDSSRGCSFINFAKRHINHTISKKIRDKLTHDRIENEAAKMDTVGRQEETFVRNLDLHNALLDLSPLRKAIIVDHYFNGLSYSEISAKYGMTQRCVKYALRVARRTLRQKIE